MNILGRHTTIGRTERTPIADLRAHRIAAARKCRAWTELDPETLVRRDRGYVVRADTDEAFRFYQGDAFSPSGTLIADMQPLAFFVEDGDVVVLERATRPWSEILYQRERARAR